MVEWIKTKMIYILGILLAISVAGNVLLATKGINIYNTDYITTTSRSDSIANSSSLAIGYIGGDTRGDWKIVVSENLAKVAIYKGDPDNLVSFYNSLTPIQFIASKTVCRDDFSCRVFYPEITPYKTETKEGKTVTKKEVRK
jgi:hypothetical protein